MEDSYPLYPHEAFRSVAETYSMFPVLYDKNVDTPMTQFLCRQLKCDEIWQPLRKNFKTRELFVHACTERADGLRILQYLKTIPLRPAEEELHLFCNSHRISISNNFSFRTSSIAEINTLRDALHILEQSMR